MEFDKIPKITAITEETNDTKTFRLEKEGLDFMENFDRNAQK
jgi:hypothetical protein